MDIEKLARPCVQQLPSYMGPLVSGARQEALVRLASNENPLGPSEQVQRAVSEQSDWISRYPDGSCVDLRLEIARRMGVEPEQVLVGNGSNEILELAGKAFLESGRSAVYSAYCFAVYPLMVQATGAEALEVAVGEDYSYDVEALASAVRADTRMLLLANPNNPTGSYLSGEQLRWLLQQLPDEVVVVLDQAYGDYVEYDDYAGWHELKDLHPALLVTRSFSKMQALAGLRVGYGIGDKAMMRTLDRVRQPFNVGVLSQVAALAALKDDDHMQRSRALNRDSMQWMQQQLAQLENLGVRVLPSAANFLAVRIPVPADELAEAMLAQGVLVRSLAPYRMPEYIRVTLGLPEENRRFIEVFSQCLHKLQ